VFVYELCENCVKPVCHIIPMYKVLVNMLSALLVLFVSLVQFVKSRFNFG